MKKEVFLTKYYEYLFHSSPYRSIYALLSNGMTIGLQDLTNQNFYVAKALYPPFEEQERIVRCFG